MTYIRQFIELKEQKAGYGFKGQMPHGTCRIEIRDDIVKVKILLNGLGPLASGGAYKAFLICVNQTEFKEYEIGSLRPSGLGTAQLEYRGHIARQADPKLAMDAYAAVVIRTVEPAPAKPRDVLVGYRQDLVTWTDKQNVDQMPPPREPQSIVNIEVQEEPGAEEEPTAEPQPAEPPAPAIAADESEPETADITTDTVELEPQGESMDEAAEDLNTRALIIEESDSEASPDELVSIEEGETEPETAVEEEIDTKPEPEPAKSLLIIEDPEDVEPAREAEEEPVPEATGDEPEETPGELVTNQSELMPVGEETAPVVSLDPSKTRCALDYMFSEYPPIYPYRESDLEWIRIDPRDMAVLPLDTWSMDNSPFILQGYTRYKHLILGRSTDKRGEDVCILGVPYRYAAKQRESGARWGFTEFKSSSCKSPSEGDYGYWLQNVPY